ncbi:hypothetical protein GYMLUDRAFT_71188 [Collybiopsis luxurians FD-317 M1]|nr:hypothetical protein GYMLUDRAFT_71188 [Collybiopsis luxurians FD-317 M1]
MSRDAAEFDCPPGLGYLPNETQRGSFAPVDRRGSAGYSIYHGGGGLDAGHANLGMTSASSSYHHHQRHAEPASPPNNNPIYSPAATPTRSTLLWTDLEPWMDEEYAKQVCSLMGWDPISIKIPRPTSDSATSQLANNAGYCLLTFPSQAHAATVLAGLSGNPPITMPNSTKPFTMNWAQVVPAATSAQSASFAPSVTPTASQPYPKEFSIFVGDLAPETSNSDLVAVFRNPVLGLRNDREPKFIRPFLSCKSAKIMLDPVTGISRGYGFVRFTDEADQQRALIEMHGLYCLSRPMRISPATAKFKPAATMMPQELAQLQHYVGVNGLPSTSPDPVTIAVPFQPQTKSVTATIASSNQPTSPTNAASSTTSSNSASSLTSRTSSSSLGATSSDSGSSTSLATTAGGSESGNVLSKLYDSNATKPQGSNSISAGFAQEHPRLPMDYNPAMGSAAAAGRYLISEESWKHHTQARAILGNLIGPNGEQLTSTDPYNTTVFVGGLSPLIQEETLRTFFAPFGDIHYVKVPVGKHCGFVQFVRKADAERAIEKMQGFPIGGSRIRLSWGRSQYKAAQAAAQAAQAAALQSQAQHQNLYNLAMQMPSSLPSDNDSAAGNGQLTQEQAIQLLQKLSQEGYLDIRPSGSSLSTSHAGGSNPYANPITNDGQGVGHGIHPLERLFISPSPTSGLYSEEKLRAAHLSGREDLVGSSSYDGRFDLQSFAAQQQPHHVQHGQPSTHQSSGSPRLHQHQSSQQYQRDLPSSRQAMSFSPFSPDPNALYGEQQRRESLSTVNIDDLNDIGGKLASTSSRPLSMSRYANYQGLMPRQTGSGSNGTSPVNRAPMPAPISRPSSGQPSSAGFEMHDLNGTLASLDLGDREVSSSSKSSFAIDRRPWGVRSPAGSSDSGQFQMTREDGSS